MRPFTLLSHSRFSPFFLVVECGPIVEPCRELSDLSPSFCSLGTLVDKVAVSLPCTSDISTYASVGSYYDSATGGSGRFVHHVIIETLLGTTDEEAKGLARNVLFSSAWPMGDDFFLGS